RKLCLVVGYRKEAITATLDGDPDIAFVEQAEQKGTAHAVLMCESHLRAARGEVIVIAGDMPLVRAATLRTLLETHRQMRAAVTLATAVLEEPRGYGRIIRDEGGRLRGIIEQRDCTPEQIAIREVNPSYYCFDAEALLWALPRIRNENAKREYYLTD